ncbi:uncharacterized protein [Dermacentor andersoni]|uniref:uncharacterized protein n=1 Tax=Dermacentor andersoni TaxID=34620 RepID=UPI0024163A24|nr:uncharacterized protein LOC129380903 [Dermacentor andersoni]
MTRYTRFRNRREEKEERQGGHALARWHASPTRQRRISLALSNTQLIVADALRTIAGRNGIVLLPVMGISVPGCIEIHRLLQGSLSTISEETPSRKTPSSIALAALPDGAKDDVSYTFSNLAIEDVLPGNRDLVLKPWYKLDERTCGSLTGHPSRLFPRAEWYPPVEMGVKDIVAQCNTMKVPWTAQGTWNQTLVASRFTVRLIIQSARDPSTRGVEATATMSGQFVECDHVPSAEYSLDVFGRRLRIHPRDTLPRALTMLKSTMAVSNGDTYGVAGPSSSIWRLHARFAPNGVDCSTAITTGVARRLVRRRTCGCRLLGCTSSQLQRHNGPKLCRRP